MDDQAEPLRIEVPGHAAVRAIFVAMGLFVIGIAVYELWRGVWPPNIGSLFFLFMIFGACTVGVPIIRGGLFGWAATWEVTPGLISIALSNPFKRRLLRLDERDVLGIRTIEREAMEGDNTWHVSIVTAGGRKFDAYDLKTKQAAEQLRDQMIQAFRG